MSSVPANYHKFDGDIGTVGLYVSMRDKFPGHGAAGVSYDHIPARQSLVMRADALLSVNLTDKQRGDRDGMIDNFCLCIVLPDELHRMAKTTGGCNTKKHKADLNAAALEACMEHESNATDMYQATKLDYATFAKIMAGLDEMKYVASMLDYDKHLQAFNKAAAEGAKTHDEAIKILLEKRAAERKAEAEQNK